MVHICVSGAISVALWAVSLYPIVFAIIASAYIFLLRNRLQMIRIDAVSRTTKMVYLLPGS